MKFIVRRATELMTNTPACEIEFVTLEEFLEWVKSQKESVIVDAPDSFRSENYTLLIYDTHIE
jgi:hypothetical protein